MFYQNMPLYIKLVNLLKAEYKIIHDMPREYKFSLGQDILDRTWELVDLFIFAQLINSSNQKHQKIEYIKKINRQFEVLKLRLRFLLELKLVSLGQASALSGDIVEIGKMIGSWLKNT